MRMIHTKKQALAMKEEDIRLQYEKPVLNAVYLFLIDIGAGRDIPDDASQKKKYIIRVHEKLTVENPFYPEDLPFEAVYPAFFKAVINGFAERKGNNIAALVGAFKRWINTGDRLSELREKHYQRHPEDRPKQLASAVSKGSDPREAEINESVRGQRIEDWSDEAIIDAHKKIVTIFNDDSGRKLLESFNGNGQIAKIKEEIESRGLVEEV